MEGGGRGHGRGREVGGMEGGGRRYGRGHAGGGEGA